MVLVDIDDYALGWDQFLHTAYAFAKADRWEEFDRAEFKFKGEIIDIKPFVKNLRRMMTYLGYQEVVPIAMMRHIPYEVEWCGIIDVGRNRKQQSLAQRYIGKTKGSFEGRVDTLLVWKPITEKLDSRLRQQGLILAFESEDDLVRAKLLMT